MVTCGSNQNQDYVQSFLEMHHSASLRNMVPRVSRLEVVPQALQDEAHA